MDSPIVQRLTPTSVGLIAVAVFGLVMSALALAGPVMGLHAPGDGPAVTPTLVAAGLPCPSGTVAVSFEAHEITTDSIKSAMVEGVEVNVEIIATDGTAASFDVDGGRTGHVFATASDAANWYDYSSRAGGGVRHDDGLAAPLEVDITSLTFCLIDEPTSTPSPSDVTPTPAADDDASLNIHKVNERGERLAGAVFIVAGMEGTFTTDALGEACITGLPADSEWSVTEIEAPAGYAIAAPASQLVEVDDDGDCDSPDVVFVNRTSIATPTPTPREGEGGGTPTPMPSESDGGPAPSVDAATPTPNEGELGGTPTPRPSTGPLPDTAVASESSTPIDVLSLVMLAALAALLYGRLARER